MSTKSTFPIGEISDVQFSGEPPGISFQHKDQKYWVYVGDTDHPKDATQALLMYGALLRSSSVTIYDSENDSNGFNVLSSIALHTERPPGPDSEPKGDLYGLAIIFLLAFIAALLFKNSFPKNFGSNRPTEQDHSNVPEA